jgi:hypothetical protein
MSLSGTAISYDSTKIQIEESDEGISISYFGDNLSGTVSLVDVKMVESITQSLILKNIWILIYTRIFL